MKSAVRDDLNEAHQDGAGAIRRRHVIYVEGYDPRGANGYFDLFRRTCERFQTLWPVSVSLIPVEIDSEDFAHWTIEARGTDWQTATRYDFLRLERFIRSDMAKPLLWQVLRGLGWYLGDVLSTAQLRIFCASWRFGLHLLCFQLLLVAWAAVAVIIGLIVFGIATKYLGWPAAGCLIAFLVAAYATLLALRPLAQRWRVIQISACWTVLRKFARGHPTWIDHAIDAGARRVIDAAKATEADELAVVGHSTGGVIASAIVARALELDPDLGRQGPRLVLLTLGSVMPAVALHPMARRMRNIVRRIVTAPALAWVDCQSRKDVMCFANFDPVAGIGIQAGPQRSNPKLWRISLRDMIAREAYGRFRWNYFRMHYQYILPGDRPAPYDYMLLIAGPRAIADWPEHDRDFMAAFMHQISSNESFRRDAVVGAGPRASPAAP